MKKVFTFILLIWFVSIYPAYAAQYGVAVIKGTQEGTNISGRVDFEEIDGALKINGVLTNAPPGKHGFHIHEYGLCTGEGRDAGGHFNPNGVKHGILATDGFSGAHAGDLGNIAIDTEGNGKFQTLLPNLSLSGGEYPIAGRAVILHEKEDDFGQPTGNAGGRIGCGTIALVEGP
ncbi:MAG: hypothetical protein A3J52_01480 [Omnitrophica bacterium RIFCSPHIGHO2_02_FULL_49_9]|nr:MAG: hypothetical protein A3J52_01480 [Omnitrophica bacterium RIFCSPHIGHO2_02_FULL_49_9]OGW90249.1 MAG: hypothetical protein A3A73_00635 [Omnitrophica bacterium RIFCSPLOWO2_01_FULL_50_24]